MRYLGLDLLRFSALFLVLGRHMNITAHPPSVLFYWRRAGWAGVDLFFTLSGFLIASLLFKEFINTGKVRVIRFLIRRGFKIYPAFWIMFIFTVVVRYFRNDFPTTRILFAELFFLQNYFGGIWKHTWSLAVEEHFYFLLVLIFFLLVRYKKSLSLVPGIFFICAISCLILRITNFYIYPEYQHYTHLFRTHLRLDTLFFGVYLAYLFYFNNLEQKLEKVPTYFFYITGALAFLPAFCFRLEDSFFLPTFGVTLIYLGSGALIFAVMRLRSSNYILNKIGFLGAASYSIYLWHLPVNIWGTKILYQMVPQDSFYSYFLIYLVGSFVLGVLMNLIVERPVLSLRDRLIELK